MALSETLADMADEATNSATSEARLNELAEIGPLRPHVAANPNTALATLLQLASEFPGEFLANPALPLHLLAQPDLPELLPEIALAQIVAMPTVAAMWLNTARKSKSKLLQDAVTDHMAINGTKFPNWELHTTVRIRKRSIQIDAKYHERTRDGKIGEGLVAIHGIAPWVLNTLARHHSSTVRISIARHADATPTVLTTLANDRTWREQYEQIHSSALSHAKTDRETAFRHGAMAKYALHHPDETFAPELLAEWAQHKDVGVRRFVAGHPHTPPSTLAELAKATDVHTLRALVGNPATPLAILRDLAASTTDPMLVEWLAANPALPMAMLEALSHDTQAQVGVARNPNIPAQMAVQLAQTRSQPVLVALASNPNIPVALLRTLLLDEHLIQNATIRQGLLHQSLPAAVFFWEDESEHYLYFVARHPNAPESMLRRLAQHEQMMLRRAVASNPATPTDVLAAFATEQRYQFELLKNPAAPHAFLCAAAAMPDIGVQLALLRRQNVPDDVAQRIEPAFAMDEATTTADRKPLVIDDTFLALISLLYAHPAVRTDVKAAYFCYALRHLQPYHDWLWRFALLSTSYAPAAALEIGATSFDWLDRYAVARHPTTPEATLRALAEHDVSRMVRAAAESALEMLARSGR